MPKWLQVTIAACAVMVALSTTSLALSGPIQRRSERTEAAVAEAVEALTRIHIAARLYYDDHYKYGDLLEIARSRASPGQRLDNTLLSPIATVHPSPDGHAYLAIIHLHDKAGVTCASFEESWLAPTPEDPAPRFPPRIAGWVPSKVGALTCRRTGWPWSWVGWAGLDVIGEGVVARAYDRSRRR